MSTTKQELQETWTVYGKTFTDRAEAEAHATACDRRDRAVEALKPAVGGKSRPPLYRSLSGPIDPLELAEAMARHPEAFAAALQILQGDD